MVVIIVLSEVHLTNLLLLLAHVMLRTSVLVLLLIVLLVVLLGAVLVLLLIMLLVILLVVVLVVALIVLLRALLILLRLVVLLITESHIMVVLLVEHGLWWGLMSILHLVMVVVLVVELELLVFSASTSFIASLSSVVVIFLNVSIIPEFIVVKFETLSSLVSVLGRWLLSRSATVKDLARRYWFDFIADLATL